MYTSGYKNRFLALLIHNNGERAWRKSLHRTRSGAVSRITSAGPDSEVSCSAAKGWRRTRSRQPVCQAAIHSHYFQLSKIINPKGPERFALFYLCSQTFLFATIFERVEQGKNAAEGGCAPRYFLHVILTVLRLRHGSRGSFRTQHYGVNSIGRT